jgi:hypothetical protein
MTGKNMNFKMAGGEAEIDPLSVGIHLDEIESNIFDNTELLGAWGQTHLENNEWPGVESSEELNPRNHIIRFKNGKEKIINLQELRFTMLCERIAMGESGPQLANAILEEYKKYTNI